MEHIPVLASEVLELLDPKAGESVIDVTVGLGGHSSLLLEKIGTKGSLVGIDTDEKNLEEAKKNLDSNNVALHHANFRDLASLSLEPCDILFADLGLSSPHLDDPDRGFSFRHDGPLDCRFDRSGGGKTAADLLSQMSEHEMVTLLEDYGEVPRAHPFVREILTVRSRAPIARTQELVDIANTVYHYDANRVLPQIFQALRIAVNDELGALTALLTDGPALLKSGGRLGIISYHSLEDRAVKRAFKELTTATKHPTTGADLSPAPFTLLTKKAIQPTEEERERNPRSRSARLRGILKN